MEPVFFCVTEEGHHATKETISETLQAINTASSKNNLEKKTVGHASCRTVACPSTLDKSWADDTTSHVMTLATMSVFGYRETMFRHRFPEQRNCRFRSTQSCLNDNRCSEWFGSFREKG